MPRIMVWTVDADNAPHVVYQSLPDGWDGMSEEDQDEYLNEQAGELLAAHEDHVMSDADVVGDVP